MTRLGNRFFTEWHKSTLGMHYFKFILQIATYLFEPKCVTERGRREKSINVDKFAKKAL